MSDRLRPSGEGFGVGWIHSYPSKLFGDALEEAERVAVRAVVTLGLKDGIAFPQLIVSQGRALVVEVAARIPGGQMADLAFHALGVDLVADRVEAGARRGGPGRDRPPPPLPPDSDPLPHRPPRPAARSARCGRSAASSASSRPPGVVQADVFLQPGETIRPVRLDGDRRGYVIATGQTNVQALERAEAAARLLYVETE